MKQVSLAIACLLSTSQAIRFSETGSELTSNDEAELIRPTLIAQNAIPHSNEMKGDSFSQGLSKIENENAEEDHRYNPAEDAQEFRQTEFTRRPIIQPAEDNMTKREKMQLIKEANEELEIRHHFPAPDSKVEEPVKSKAQQAYELQAHQNMFAKYIDNDNLDNTVGSDTMKMLGVADDTSNVQLNKLPYLEDVGRREYTDSHEQYEWYPGDRRVYEAIEDRFDFAQRNAPNQQFAQASLPDVGNRDFGSAHELHAWYPGDRRYYNYEGNFDHLAQIPDVGNRDYGEAHSSHAWYPGDRRYYDFEGKFDHAQKKATHNYAQRY